MTNALSTQDHEFMERTASVWNSGVALGTLPSAEGASNTTAQSGWHVWFYGDGPQWLYWQRRSDGNVAGVEVERAALLAALLGKLPDENATSLGCLRLASSDGTVLFQQGVCDLQERSVPAATLPCAAPLQHWHWDHIAAPGESRGPSAWPYLLGGTGAAAFFAAIGLLVFMTYRRDMRVASQRVSFVNQVSHELKTPLTNIRLYSELARGATGDETARYLDVVEEETSRLSRLIHNVLTFAREERHGLETHIVSGDLVALVSRIAEHWKPLLQRKGTRLVTELCLEQPALFDADATEQILGNLLSNIEKYAAGTTATLEVRQQDDHAMIRVSDDGPGIPAKAARRIFEPFFRARSDIAEGVSGTGLGLSIARALAEAQGGSLHHASTAKGASFVLKLPIAKPIRS